MIQKHWDVFLYPSVLFIYTFLLWSILPSHKYHRKQKANMRGRLNVFECLVHSEDSHTASYKVCTLVIPSIADLFVLPLFIIYNTGICIFLGWVVQVIGDINRGKNVFKIHVVIFKYIQFYLGHIFSATIKPGIWAEVLWCFLQSLNCVLLLILQMKMFYNLHIYSCHHPFSVVLSLTCGSAWVYPS